MESLISGYLQNGKENEAIVLYVEMLKSGVLLDHMTFGSINQACSALGDFELGKQLHAQVIKSEFGSEVIAQNALVSLYGKSDQIDEASILFSRIELKDLISWCSIIVGFSQLGCETDALSHFKKTLFQGIYKPNSTIFCSVLVPVEVYYKLNMESKFMG